MSKGPARRIRLRGVVAYPAVSAALVASIALVLTPFGPSRVMALDAPTTPTTTTAPTTAAPTTAVPTTAAISAAPTTVPTSAAPTLTGAPTSAPGPVPSPVPGAVPSLTSAPADVPVGHYVLARIEGSEIQANYLAVDALVLDASQFQTFRVRFQLHNNGTGPVTTTPQLEYRPDGAAGFVVVPVEPQLGVPLHVAREWVPNTGPEGGTKQGPLGENIAAVDLKMPSQVGVAAIGHRSMGVNPDQAITLPASSHTEQEFTVELTMDAKYLTGYELRITDGGAALAGTQVARIVLGPQPAVQLSAGQRQGVRVIDPTSTNAAGVIYPLVSAPTVAADTSRAVAAVNPSSSPRYALASGSLSPATVVPSTTVLVSTAGIQGSHSTVADQCGACHRGHTAQAPNLLAQNSQSALCFSCHDGTSAKTNVKSQYTDKLIPKNDTATREFYSHDAAAPATSTAATTHTRSELDEFRGVSNRHSECADCHNSHRANATDSKESLDGAGWDASGRLAGVSGVSVVNNPTAGQPPTYEFLDGIIKPVTREYELCFKCHSGFTKLTSNTDLKPSQYALDKGVEFNPNNPSFHPVEAAGTNKTEKMDDSLAGSSPYKLWNFNKGSTVRCLNCHAGGGTPGATPPPPAAGGDLAPHTSSNRGILLENYKDRVLKSTSEAYSAGDFALCYMCHAEAPFANKSDPPDGTSNATNFRFHGLHLTGLAKNGSGGTDIDTAGDGQGNAICAECHFRIHSTTDKVGAQDIPGSRLLNFAPNVQPSSGTLSWTPGLTSGGSCTLTCHGYTHDALAY
jgi:predicted CXXCH cytochrome family protein